MKRANPTAAAPSRSAFDELLDTEREIAEVAATATRDAQTRLLAARTEAASSLASAAAALASELAEFDERARDVRAAAVREVESEAAQAIARYGSLSDGEILRLALAVIAEATGLAREGPP